MKKQDCPHCGHSGRPVKGTAGRAKHKGLTFLCVACKGAINDGE